MLPAPGLKCPECVAAGITSTVRTISMAAERIEYEQGADPTNPDEDREWVRGWELLYDAQGAYHIHDPIEYVFEYSCDNDPPHYFSEIRQNPCPQGDYP